MNRESLKNANRLNREIEQLTYWIKQLEDEIKLLKSSDEFSLDIPEFVLKHFDKDEQIKIGKKVLDQAKNVLKEKEQNFSKI